MKSAVDPQYALVVGDTMLRAVALGLALIHGGYAILLTLHGESLWALSVYDTAKSVLGGITFWIIIAVVASVTLIVGTFIRNEKVVGCGATISALWLAFFATAFGIDAYNDPTPVALPGVVIYGGTAIIAAARVGAAMAVVRPYGAK